MGVKSWHAEKAQLLSNKWRCLSQKWQTTRKVTAVVKISTVGIYVSNPFWNISYKISSLNNVVNAFLVRLILTNYSLHFARRNSHQLKFTSCGLNWFTDRNEWPNRPPFEFIGVSLDRNDEEVINLLLVSCYVSMYLKLRKYCSFWPNILDVRGKRN